MNLNDIFQLTWKKAWIIIIAAFISIILHNLISGLTGTEEPFFFIIVIFIIPIYFLICGIYTLVKKLS